MSEAHEASAGGVSPGESAVGSGDDGAVRPADAVLLGPRTERERARLEWLIRWSSHAVAILVAAWTVVGVWPFAEDAARRWGVSAPVLYGAVTLLTAVWVGAACRLTQLYCAGARPSSRQLRSFLVLSFAWLLVLVALGGPGAETAAGGSPAAISVLGPVPLLGAGMVAGMSRRWWWLLLGGVLAVVIVRVVSTAVGLPGYWTDRNTWMAAVFVVVATLTGASTMWMVDVISMLWRSRQVVADLAVSEERLRFSRDLHDVFGRVLSTVAVKSELAAEFARRGDERAVTEMEAVRDLAQTSLADVRSLVRGYRNISLVDELVGARSVLRAAGITTRIDVPGGLDATATRLSGPVASALAWVVREGVTNVLRHGNAGDVAIVLEEVGESGESEKSGESGVSGKRVRLLITNEVGVERDSGSGRPARRGLATAPNPPGTGLTGLRERVVGVGGTLEHHAENGRFRLVANVPVA